MITPSDNFGLIRGMSQELPAHVPAVGSFQGQTVSQHWWYTLNARFRRGRIIQIPSTAYVLTTSGDTTFITVIGAIPTIASSVPFMLSGKGLWLLDFSAAPFDPTHQTLVAQPGGFVIDTSTRPSRWAHVETIAGLYYTNLLNKIINYNGIAAAYNYSGAGPDYKAKYMVNFYNHLVVANVYDGATPYPLRVGYSDIGNFTIFEPLTTNEADYFDIQNNEQNNVFNLGITGLHQVGDLLAIYTAGSIWNARYVGFDNGVMSFTRQIEGIGAWLPYSVVGVDRYNCFIAKGDFFVYDGTTCQSIGGPILDFFFDDLSADADIRNNTWGTLDIENNEVRWYYPSRTSTGACDKCVVFNWQTRDWYVEAGLSKSAELAFGSSSYRYIDLLDKYSATINGLDAISVTIDGLDSSKNIDRPLFGNVGSLLTESNVIPSSDSFQQPEFESRDFIQGVHQDVDELETILIDAEVNPAAIPDVDTPGWIVYVSVRNYINQPVVWQLVGKYLGTEPELRFTNLRLAGRIFRFKFVAFHLAASHFYGFSPNFYAGATEK